jgi:HPt (histidine-containing phosphotransfer) domain-containing protein
MNFSSPAPAVFLIDSPDLRQQLSSKLSEGDTPGLHSAAHCAKSAIGNFGAATAVAAATALEAAAKSGDTALLPGLTETLCTEMLRVEEAIRQEVL